MAIYRFQFNQIDVEVSDTKGDAYVKFTDTLATSNTRKYKYEGISTADESGIILIKFFNLLQDGNHTITKEKWDTYVTQAWYDYYYNIVTGLNLGTITARACINTFLADNNGGVSIFGEALECFSSANNHTFFRPIDVTLVGTPETVEGNDASVVVQVNNNTEAQSYEYSIDEGATWQSSPTFSGLTNGTYTVITKNITESALVGFEVSKTKSVIITGNVIE